MCTISFGERCRSIKVSVGWVFFNCNRTEWSAVWSEIICDFKIKRVHMESLIPNMISDQNYTTQSSVTEYLFITSVLKSQIHWLNEFFLADHLIFHWSIVLILFEKSCKSCVSFSCNLIDFCKLKPWNLTDCCVLAKLSHWPGKRCDLEHKWVQFECKLHRWEAIRLQGSKVIPKWM